MLKFLYVGDVHGASKVPSSRTDNFIETRTNKIREILKIAKTNKVDAILQGGDFLNKANVNSEYLTNEISLWKDNSLSDVIVDVLRGEKSFEDLKNELEKTIPIIGTIGNHELIGGELDSFEKTSLNVLVQSGFMQIATKEKPIIFTDNKENFNVAITSSPYTHSIDNEDKSAYIINEKAGDFHIHLVHGMLMNKSYGKKFKHTVVNEIAFDTLSDLTINGHDHIGYDEIEIEGKKFINPGSPFRLTAEKKEIARMPKVLLIEVSKEEGIKLTPIYLQTAKKGEEVLSREHLDKKLEKEAKIENVKSIINKANIKKGYDITEIIKNIGETKNIDKEIVKEVVDEIVVSMNDMITPFEPKGEYIIERLEIKNFQSHKDTVLEFTNGLNVLSGPSRNGKSAILRALREVYDCYMKNPRRAIHFGEDFFRITLYLSNGYIITREVHSKKNGFNGYKIFDPFKGTEEKYNTKALPMIQEILGFNKVKLTEKNKVNLNFSTQGESWFMLGNNMTSPDKAKLIGALYGTNYADATLKNISSQTKKINTEINIVDKDISNLELETLNYDFVNDYKNKIEQIDSLMLKINELDSKLKKVKEIEERKKNIENDIKIYNDLLLNLESNKNQINDLLNESKLKFNKVKEAYNVQIKRRSILIEGKSCRAIEQELKKVLDLKDYILKARNLIDDVKSKKIVLANAIKLDKNLKDLENEINYSKPLLLELNKIPDLEELKKVKHNLANLKRAYQLEINKKKIEKEIIVYNNKKEELNKQILENIRLYKEKLQNMKSCPVCQSHIDENVINDIIKHFFNI